MRSPVASDDEQVADDAAAEDATAIAAEDDPSATASRGLLGVAAVVVLLALVLLVAGAAVLGVGPIGDAPAAGDAGQPTTTAGSAGGGATAGGEGSGGGDATVDEDGDEGATNPADHVRPFTVVVEAMAECGRTCRDVTASLTNNGGNPRAGVVVETVISAGEETVWEGSESLGTFESGETKTHTERVEIGLLDGAKIQGNDGYVTVVTTVRWEGGSATYRERRQVA